MGLLCTRLLLIIVFFYGLWSSMNIFLYSEDSQEALQTRLSIIQSSYAIDEPPIDLWKQQALSYRVALEGGNYVPVSRRKQKIPYIVTNYGTKPDIITITASSTRGWVDVSSFPQIITLQPNESYKLWVLVSVPQHVKHGEQDELRIDAISQGYSTMSDGITVKIEKISIAAGVRHFFEYFFIQRFKFW